MRPGGGVSNCSRHKLHIAEELLPRPAVVKVTMRIFFKTQNTFRCEVKAVKTQGLKQTVLDLNMSNLGAPNREPRKWRSVVHEQGSASHNNTIRILS